MTGRLLTAARRPLSTVTGTLDALDGWIATPKSLALTDHLSPTRLADLYITLPTRSHDDTVPVLKPTGTPLGYAHHLAFFHQHTPESRLRTDGTDPDLCPPAPFTRRMWASGRMCWHDDDAVGSLKLGDTAHARSTVVRVDKRRPTGGAGAVDDHPKVFVTQRIEMGPCHVRTPAIVEERTHVFLAHQAGHRSPRQVDGLPRSQFSFTYTPTPTTLFRFSALTFNAHLIHLDKEYARNEGYPERLVHGPLTALMLVETLLLHHPSARLRAFEYRARNPVVVDRACTIHGAITQADEDGCKAEMWGVDEQGVVGMTGNLVFLL